MEVSQWSSFSGKLPTLQWAPIQLCSRSCYSLDLVSLVDKMRILEQGYQTTWTWGLNFADRHFTCNSISDFVERGLFYYVGQAGGVSVTLVAPYVCTATYPTLQSSIHYETALNMWEWGGNWSKIISQDEPRLPVWARYSMQRDVVHGSTHIIMLCSYVFSSIMWIKFL